MVSDGVGIPNEVQPVGGEAFPKVWRSKQFVDEPGVKRWGSIGLKGLNHIGIGWESG